MKNQWSESELHLNREMCWMCLKMWRVKTYFSACLVSKAKYSSILG